MDITKKAMLVRLSISQWTARKYDKNISDEVANEYHAGKDAGRYNKILIAQEAIKAIQKVVGEARKFHYENTLPWEDDGARILPATNFMDYSKEIRDYRQMFESEVKRFLDSYDTYVADARSRLNGMFKESDYPCKAELEQKYAFETSISPLPAGKDFRVSLQGSEIDKIRKSIEERVGLAQEAAMKDLWDRLYKVVDCMVERLSKKDAVFRDSLIGNVQDLVNLLPNLNLADDPSLEDMRRDVESKLCGYAPDTLRENPRARKKAADDAQAILDAMSGYMGRQAA